MVKLQILAAWMAMACGPVLLWRRRDNLFGYLQFGFFVTAIVVPVLGTTVVDDAPGEIATRYADLMTMGAACFLVALAVGGRLGEHIRLPRFTFADPSPDTPPAVSVNARRVAVGGLVALAGAFFLLGYVPILAADPTSAKYGVGVYAAGFARGSLVYNVALLVTGTVLPAILALVLRHRRMVDVAIAFALLVGVTASLSRVVAFTGPLVFLIALAIQRKWRAWTIVASVCLAYVGGSAFNSVVSLTPLAERQSFAAQVSASAPDVTDHLAFLDGFERGDREQISVRPLIAAFTLDKSDFNPATYALEVRTGLSDVTGLASGGLRLPAPLWGYASFGTAGAVVWCLVSGLFVGIGTVMIRRAVAGAAAGSTRQVLNLVLAWVFYEGTFGVVGEFYFLPRVAVIGFGLAIVLGFRRVPRIRRHSLGSPPFVPRERVLAQEASR